MLVQRLDSFRLKNDLNDLSGNNEKKPSEISFRRLCGERGIRTPGTSRYDGFQDRCNRPLYHLSKFSLDDYSLVFLSGCKGTTIFWFHQIF